MPPDLAIWRHSYHALFQLILQGGGLNERSRIRQGLLRDQTCAYGFVNIGSACRRVKEPLETLSTSQAFDWSVIANLLICSHQKITNRLSTPMDRVPIPERFIYRCFDPAVRRSIAMLHYLLPSLAPIYRSLRNMLPARMGYIQRFTT
jgi:hypothetical protein